jgi:hypothetical protein
VIAVRIVRDGAVVRETVFAQLPVRLGRGAENEFVVFDPSVSRAHAVIEEVEGALRLRDLGSANGVHLGPARAAALPISGTVRCHLGAVEIEVDPLSLEATQPIQAAEWKRFDQRRSTADHIRYLLLGLAGWILGVVVEPAFWSPWQKTRAVTLLWHGLGILIALPILALLLLMVLRVVGRRVRMADTLLALAHVAWIPPAVFALAFLLYYVLPLSAHGLAAAVIGLVAGVAAVVHLASVRRPAPRRRFQMVWAAVAGAIVVGFGAISSLAAEKMGMPQVKYHVQVPLGTHAGPARDLDAYFAAIRESSEEAARAAETVRVRQDDH